MSELSASHLWSIAPWVLVVVLVLVLWGVVSWVWRLLVAESWPRQEEEHR